METLILIVVVLFIGAIAFIMIQKKREKEISITVMTADIEEAKKLGATKLMAAIPKEYLKTTVYPNGMTELQITLKR